MVSIDLLLAVFVPCALPRCGARVSSGNAYSTSLSICLVTVRVRSIRQMLLHTADTAHDITGTSLCSNLKARNMIPGWIGWEVMTSVKSYGQRRVGSYQDETVSEQFCTAGMHHHRYHSNVAVVAIPSPHLEQSTNYIHCTLHDAQF